MNTELTITTTSNATLTMSSREIAELTGKRHPDVKRDIDTMMDQLGEDVSKFARIYFDSMNRKRAEYRLPKDLTITLVAGYSAVLRHRIVKRWMELEAAAAQPQPAAAVIPDFANPAEPTSAWAYGPQFRPFHPHSGYSHSWVNC